MERFNAACKAVVAVAFRERTANQNRLQQLVYHAIRAQFGLSAQLTVRAIRKGAEAHRRDKSVQPTFRTHRAIVYDQRVLPWKSPGRVSMPTLRDRQRIPVILGGFPC